MLSACPVARWEGSLFKLLIGGLALFAFFAVMLPAQRVYAATDAPSRFVATTGSDGGANPCTDKFNPCLTLQRAINVAGTGEEIAVAVGTYPENASVVSKNLTIRGGWDSGFNTRDPASNVTTLDGQNLGTVVCFDSSQSTLDGFTITNGYASLSDLASDGIYNCGSASSHGGGILVRGNSNMTISNNTIINNVANRRGGGVFVVGSVVSINNNKVYSNTAKQGAGIWGGGAMGLVTLVNKLISIKNNEIAYNTTVTNTDNSGAFDSDAAGLMLNFGSLSEVVGNQIYLNRILAPDGYGAALRVQFGSTSVISGNQILSNTCFISPISQFSSTLGGGMELVEASAQILNNRWENNANVAVKVDNAPYAIIDGNTIVNNRSDRGGAGIWIIRKTVFTITNNTIAGNIASGTNDGGGAINLNDIGQAGVGSGLIANNLIYNNTSNNRAGGGIGMVGMPGLLVIKNNQIYNNQAKDGAGVALEDVQNVTLNGNRISGNTAGSFTSGVYIRGSTNASTSVLSLLNNFIYENDDIGVNAQNVGTMTLANNTIVNNGVGVSAYPAVGGQNVQLINNIVSNHSGCALTNGPYTLNNNLFFSNGGSGCAVASGLNSNPLYVSSGIDDYRLSSNSPAIDAGTATGAPDTDYFGTARPQGSGDDIGAHEFTSVQQPQSITFNPNPLPDRPANNAPFIVNASASSGLAITFSASGVCSVATLNNTQATVTLSGITGTCTITASQPGNGSYSAATPVVRPFQVLAVAQTITFGAISDKLAGNTFGLAPTASSGLSVALAASGACSLNGTQVTAANLAGSCTITATQSGNATYAAAPPVARTFTVRQTQSISFDPVSALFTIDAPSNLSASATSGLAVGFASLSTSICTVSGTTLTLQRVAGNCIIVAAQAGNASFTAATPVTRTIVISKASQVLNLEPIVNKLVTDAPFDALVTATSNLTVTLTSDGECSVSGQTVTLSGVSGQCTITATQAGDAAYLPATPVSQTFLIQTLAQAITFEPITDKTISDVPFAVSASTNSGLAVNLQASGVCQIFTTQVVLSGTEGVCTITATQPGNAIYASALPVIRSFAVHNPFKTDQVINVPPLSDILTGNGPIMLHGTTSSNLTITYTSQTPLVCSVSGNFVTVLGPGTCTVQASQAGDDQYNPATPVTVQFVVRTARNRLFLPNLSR